MLIASWNVNSFRARREHLTRWLSLTTPEIVGLQEIKDTQLEAGELNALGYSVVSSLQKSYNGVALLTRGEPTDVLEGIPGFADEQRRLIAATIGHLRVINCYVPNGEALTSEKYAYKLRWLEAWIAWLQSELAQHPRLVVMGDFNIAPRDADVSDRDAIAGGTHVSPPEREAFARLLGLGLFETAASSAPSWWDYQRGAFQRDRGMRIDHVLVSAALMSEGATSSTDRRPRTWERPSDHAPVICAIGEPLPSLEEFVTVTAPAAVARPALDSNRQRWFSAAESATEPSSAALFDGHGLIFRYHFGMPPMRALDGSPSGALNGTLRALLNWFKSVGATPGSASGSDGPALIVTFDSAEPTFRHAIFAGYKAGRSEMPPELPIQVTALQEILSALGVAWVSAPGIEADDLMASYALAARGLGLPVRLYSSDQDLLQLVGDDLTVIGSKDAEFTPSAVLERYGLKPSQWLDYRALTGDSSDRIPGARGIGPKSAVELLALHGDLATLYANLDDPRIKKHRAKLEAATADVELSKRLSQLEAHAMLPFDLSQAATLHPNLERLAALVQQWKLEPLMALMGMVKGRAAAAAPSEITRRGPSLPRSATAWAGIAIGITDGLRVAWDGSSEVADTTALNAVGAKAHSAKSGIPAGLDPVLAGYLLDTRIMTVDDLCAVRAEPWPGLPLERARVTHGLIGDALAALNPRQLQTLLEVDVPVQGVLNAMEKSGIKLDPLALAQLRTNFGDQLTALEGQVFQAAGRPFNLGSRDELENLLFDELKLTSDARKTTTGKRTVNQAALEELRDAHPMIAPMLEFRALQKLMSTYVLPLPKLMDAGGRVHTTYNLTDTATGRISSTNPNLQNIPIRSEQGKQIRGAFVTKPGWMLVSADFSQVELRLLAEFSGDPALLHAFESGADVHRATAASVLGIAIEGVTSAQRSRFKTVNYGLVYGLGAQGLSQQLGVGRREAATIIDAYFTRFSGVKGYFDGVLNACRRDGYVEDIGGRRRWLPDISASNAGIRSAAERAAINMPIQGSAAHAMKVALLRVAERIQREGWQARMLLQVHDELVLEAPEDEVERVVEMLTEEMPGAFTGTVRLEVEVGVGLNWLDAK